MLSMTLMCVSNINTVTDPNWMKNVRNTYQFEAHLNIIIDHHILIFSENLTFISTQLCFKRTVMQHCTVTLYILISFKTHRHKNHACALCRGTQNSICKWKCIFTSSASSNPNPNPHHCITIQHEGFKNSLFLK